MPSAEIWTGRTIAAAIIGLVILGVSIMGVLNGLGAIKEHRAEIDARRVAGTLEAVDQTPGTVVRLNFVQPYTVDVAEDSIILRGGSSPVKRLINLHSNLKTGSTTESKYVCVRNDAGAVSLSTDCSVPVASSSGGSSSGGGNGGSSTTSCGSGETCTSLSTCTNVIGGTPGASCSAGVCCTPPSGGSGGVY